MFNRGCVVVGAERERERNEEDEGMLFKRTFYVQVRRMCVLLFCQ